MTEIKNTAILCACCDTLYNADKNFKEYEVILMCPKCVKQGKLPLFPSNGGAKPYFNSYRMFLEVLTEVLVFLDKEILPLFDKFEVLK